MTWVRKKLKVSWVEENEEERKARLESNLKAYEASYGKSSQEMLEQVSNFQMEETEDVFDWLCDYQDLRGIEEAKKRPRDSEGNVIIPEMTDAEIEEYYKQIRLNISDNEIIYKMTSEEMLELLKKGKIEETADILKWKWALEDLRTFEEETPTAGKPTKITAPSTPSD